MPGLFDSLTVRGLTLKNRIVMAPMCMYQASDDSEVTDWHLAHYGARAIGGVGLIIIEATGVEARGRITPRDLGLYDDRHIEGMARLVRVIHRGGALAAVQLAHSGRKGQGVGAIVAPSAIPFSDKYDTPHALTEAEIDDVVEAFAKAARRAVAAGFDALEVHAAHGYLLHQFLSPHSNKRSDKYGGPLENRLRLHLRVIEAVRREMPEKMPLFMRVSASEYLDDGYTAEEAIELCRRAKAAGVDVIDVSSGGAASVAPVSFPGYQVPFAEKIRAAAGVPVSAVGLLDSPQLALEVLMNGRADLVALGRGLLRDPNWPLNAAVALGLEPPVPESYRRGYLR